MAKQLKTSTRQPLALTVLCLIAATAFAACDGREEIPFLALDAEPSAEAEARNQGHPELRLGVAAMMSARTTVDQYAPLLSYLSQKLGRRAVLIQRRTYGEMNALVRVAGVDLAFVCSGAYVEGKRRFGMELLVVPSVAGETTYRSYILARGGLGVISLSELRGMRFAFTDVLSNSGFLYPSIVLKTLHEDPATFFSGTIFTNSHEASIRAVAEGLVDGAAVDSLIYEDMVRRDPEVADRVEIVSRSDPFGIPPVVVNPRLPGELKETLRATFRQMADDPAAAPALDALGIEGFVTSSDEAYASVGAIVAALNGHEENR